jgi:AcrR family transcriptional regulator
MVRLSADERRQQILVAAKSEFARHGLKGTSTEAIAERAGISQPYLFRLFGTKKALFLACVDSGFGHVIELFRAAAAGHEGDEALDAMALAYTGMLANREELLAQMQAYAACSDTDVRDLCRRRFAEVWRTAAELSGAGEDEVRAFMATGMLMNVAAAIDLPEVAEPGLWAEKKEHR